MSRSHGQQSNRSLFVRNVSEQTRSDELRNIFEDYGHVSDVYIPHDYFSHRPRGFAYIQFDEVRAAEDAVHHLNGIKVKGRELEVEFAVGDRKTPSQMRGKGRSYRSGHFDTRRYRSSRDERRRRSRSRSRDRNRKRNRSRNRSRSRSPHRSHRHHRHHHNHSRSRSKSPTKSRKGHEHRHHSKSRKNDNDSLEYNIKYENHSSSKLVDGDSNQTDRKYENNRDLNHSTHSTPSSIERTNGDKPEFGDNSKDGSAEESSHEI